MLAVEDVLSELAGDDASDRGLPPGFRFHPTDEELVTFYLASKVFNGGLCGFDIAEVDLNRCEPWELPEGAKMGEKEWYFFSLRDRKYPTGLRTNRATAAGYWKATGKDKEVFGGGGGCGGGAPPPLLGMKKTLVFYKGRAPRGVKTKWVMHEYRLDGDLSLRHTCKEEWVICRVFNKTGDRKNNNVGIQNHQNYINIHNLEYYSSPSSSLTLPPLLEAPTTTLPHFPLSSSSSSLHNHHNHHHQYLLNLHENDELKTLINNPVVTHLNSIIFSSSLEDHSNLAGGQTQKQVMKTESGNYNYNCRGDDINDLGLQDQFQNTLLFQEADFSLLGLPSSSPPPLPVHAAPAAVSGDFHLMFDSLETWPLDQ